MESAARVIFIREFRAFNSFLVPLYFVPILFECFIIYD
jgi:hypothetical protein